MLAHLVATHAPEVPLVWVRVEPLINPDCLLVRDVFLAQYPGARYSEHTYWATRTDRGWMSSGALGRGFTEVKRVFGESHVSGVRGEESGARYKRMTHWGISSAKTCAPIGWWSSDDVFAYLSANDLPVHPAYACNLGGGLDRKWLRVSSIGGIVDGPGGRRGDERGRADWERTYYGDDLRALNAVAGCDLLPTSRRRC